MEMVPIFLSGLSDWFLAKRFVQHIIYFIHAQFFLEAADSRIFIDMYHFDACDFCIIFPVFSGQII